MIKRISAVTILLLYLTSYVGFAVNMHFCGQQLSSVSINSAPQKCCAKLAKPMKCCNDKHVTVKVTDKYKVEATAAKVPAISTASIFVKTNSFDSYYRRFAVFYTSDFKQRPPQFSAVPFTIQNCVFRI